MTNTKAIGLDIGTTTICGVVVDAVTGEVLKRITKQNEAFIQGEKSWERLQDVGIITTITQAIVAEFINQYQGITCIGVTGQMHGIVYITDEGEAVSPLFTWQDGRGDQEYKEGLSYAGYLSKITGYSLSTGFGAVTHFYNHVNHLVPPLSKSFCTIMDYIVMKLSSTDKPVIHPSNAASIGLFNIEKGCFDETAIKQGDMASDFFPEVTKEGQVIVSENMSIPVAVGIGDNQASFIGSVKNNRECLLVNVGTSSQISVFTDQFRTTSSIELRPFMNNQFILVGSSLCGGRAYALLEHFFREVVEIATEKKSKGFYEIMESLAEDFVAVNNPLEITTQFSGTRSHPESRGSINNLGTDNFTPKHFTVGVLQGIVNELKALYEIMIPMLKHKPQMLIGSGNGIRMNKSLQRIISKSFNMPLCIPVCEEEAAYGATVFALFGMGFFKSLEEAQGLIQYQ